MEKISWGYWRVVLTIFPCFLEDHLERIIGISINTNSVQLLVHIFCIHIKQSSSRLCSPGRKQSQFNSTYRYIDDALSINNPIYKDTLHEIYPRGLEIQETPESRRSALFLDVTLTVILTPYCVTTVRCQLPHNHIPLLSSTIPSSPTWGVCISQLITYTRTCSKYDCFVIIVRRPATHSGFCYPIKFPDTLVCLHCCGLTSHPVIFQL